jgi:hypothetical protein
LINTGLAGSPASPFSHRENTMHKSHFVMAIGLSGLIALAAGCQKQTEPPAPVTPPAKAEETALKKEAAAVVETAKETAQQAATAVAGPATQAVQAVSQTASAASDQAQTIIDAAKKQISEGKWQELAQTLPKLQGLKLTPEQEKSLMDLKTQLEKMVQDALGKQPALPGGVVPGK